MSPRGTGVGTRGILAARPPGGVAQGLQEGTRDLGEDSSVLGHPQRGGPRVGARRGCSSWVPTGWAAAEAKHRARCPPPGVPNALSTHQEGAPGPTPAQPPQHQGRPRPLPTSPRRGSSAPRSPPKIPLPSALLNSLAAGKRQQGRNEAPNVITVLVSLPPASSQPHLSRRQRAGREERNQCLSLA